VKKRFLLRLDPAVYRLLEAWAADELRSVNGQIEYLLVDALRRAGRLKGDKSLASSGQAAGPTARKER
jgi:hypothetical protein